MDFSHYFLLTGPMPSDAVSGTYHSHLVLLSLAMEFLASYVLLDVGSRLRSAATIQMKHQTLWIYGAAIAIGVGEWSMHFIGSLSYQVPLPGGIDLKYIFFSFLVGLVGTIYILHLVKNKNISRTHLFFGGIIFGLAIVLMHYVASEKIRDNVILYYRPSYFLAALFFGFIAGQAAVWLILFCTLGGAVRQMAAKLFGAFILTLTMGAIHYTAVAGTIYVPKTIVTAAGVTHEVITAPNLLAATIAVIVVLILGMIIVISIYKQALFAALQEKNVELEAALEHLKQAQGQLVQSAKMASLGQLIAGISHEINTPAGAILAAVNLVKEDYTALLEQLIKLIGSLPPELSQRYLMICNKIMKSSAVSLSTEEIRKNSQAIEEVLQQHDLHNSHLISRNLATIGLTDENVDEIIPLLKTKEVENIHRSLFKLGMSQIHIRDIKLAIERVVDLVQALKLYSQVSKGELKYADIKQQLDNTLIILHNKLKRNMIVEKEYEDVPKIKCYAEQLNQVWTNLINNAVESLHGNGKIILRIKRQNANHIKVEVEDNGPGISPDILPHIFDPYFTTKQAGTGLGLSIARDVVSHNQGKIIIDSSPKRTIFSVILPIEVTDVHAKES